MGRNADIISALRHATILLQPEVDTQPAHNKASQVHQAEIVHVKALDRAQWQLGRSLTAAEACGRHISGDKHCIQEALQQYFFFGLSVS